MSRRKLILLAIATTVVSAILFCLWLLWLLPSSEQLGVRVTISKETTVITEPLRPDGYPDYLEALNIMASKGVTPENNAMVLLLRAFGPGAISPSIRSEYFRRLGIEPLPEQGDYFVRLTDYLEAKAAHLTEHGPAGEGELPTNQRTGEESYQIQFRPWSRNEFPLVADWLEANEKPLRLIVQACSRPRFYAPYCVEQSKASAPVASLPMPHLTLLYDAREALLARANLLLSDGEVEQACEYLLACHRLARLLGQEPFFGEAISAYLCHGIACKGYVNLTYRCDVSRQQVNAYRAQLCNLPPLPDLVEKIDHAQRLLAADAICAFARGGIRRLQELTYGPTGEHSLAVAGLAWFRSPFGFDADLALRMANEHFDRLVAVGRLPTRAERIHALEELENEVNKRREALSARRLFWELLRGKSPRRLMTEAVAELVLILLEPNLANCLEAQQMAQTVRKLTDLALALGAYRTDHGQYPESLAALVPKYIAEVPKDDYTGGQLKYRREADGYLLYAVGPNMRDDGGYGSFMLPRKEPPDGHRQPHDPGDDVGIRLPPPKLP